MTDEHLNYHANRYVRHGLRDCGVTLIQYLAAPERYAPLERLLPRQRVAAGKALAEMSEPMQPTWCHGCGYMRASRGAMSGMAITAECPECAERGEAAALRRKVLALVTLWDECQHDC